MNIEVSQVSARYAGASDAALKNVSFTVREGRRLCLMGANGSGKTTLLRVLLGILPSEGEIKIGGRSLKKLKRREVAERIALMTQIPETYFSYTVRETVMQGRFLHSRGLFNMAAKKDREIVEAVLGKTGLTKIAEKKVTELSGGQRQRVFLARTLAQDTPFLFLDEPTNHMDLRYQAELADYLEGWSKGTYHGAAGDVRHTLVAVFHDINLTLRLADDVVLLKEGQVLASGPVEETLNQEVLREAFEMDIASYMQQQSSLWDRIIGAAGSSSELRQRF